MNDFFKILTALAGAGIVTLIWNVSKAWYDTRRSDELRLLELNDKCMVRYGELNTLWASFNEVPTPVQIRQYQDAYLLHFSYIATMENQREHFSSTRASVYHYLQSELKDWRYDMFDWIMIPENLNYLIRARGNYGGILVKEFLKAIDEHGGNMPAAKMTQQALVQAQNETPSLPGNHGMPVP